MTRTAQEPAVSGEREAEQQQRHARVLDAAAQLASEGGYEAVQMRAVAERADVAIGTLYRYVGSKDELLLRCLERFIDDVTLTLGRSDGRTDTPAEELLGSIADRLTEDFGLTSALVKAFTSTSAETKATRERLQSTTSSLFSSLFAHRDAAFAGRASRVLGHVCFSSLVRLAGGDDSIDLAEEIGEAVRLILDSEG